MNENTGRPYPPLKFAALVILLAAVVIFIAWSNFAEGQKSVERTGGDYENVLAASLSMKFYYALSEFSRTYPGFDQKSDRDLITIRERAIVAFRIRAEQRPLPSNLRPLIVAAYKSDKPRYISQLLKVLGNSKAARAEGDMWKGIYVDGVKPSPRVVQSYSSTIDRLDLGWYGHLVKRDLFEKAQDPKQAAREMKEAVDAIAASVVGCFVLMFAFLLMLPVGLVLGIVYIVRKVKGYPSAPIEEASADPVGRTYVAGYLLEVFLGYLVVFLLIHYAVLPLFVTQKMLHNIPRIILLETVASVAWGIIAMIYLHTRLCSAGWRWKDVGLTSHSTRREIVWGIGAYIAAVPLMAGMSLLSRIIFKNIHTPSNQIIPLLVKSQNIPEKIAIFFLVSVAAPFIEETFFRGALFTGLRAKWGTATAVVASGIIFALMHPLPSSFLPIFTLGAVFAVVRNQRGSLIPGMVAHCINNTVALVMLLIITAGD